MKKIQLAIIAASLVVAMSSSAALSGSFALTGTSGRTGAQMLGLGPNGVITGPGHGVLSGLCLDSFTMYGEPITGISSTAMMPDNIEDDSDFAGPPTFPPGGGGTVTVNSYHFTRTGIQQEDSAGGYSYFVTGKIFDDLGQYLQVPNISSIDFSSRKKKRDYYGWLPADLTPVPEPTTMIAGAGALGLALLGIGRARRSRVVRIGK